MLDGAAVDHDRRRRHGRRSLLAGTRPEAAAITYNVANGSAGVDDTNGHGTFVASLRRARGFGGQAQLMVVQANRGATFSDVDEAAGIVWAVDHGARIVNLSLSGSQTSPTERAAVRYATKKGVLLVAAAGNGGQSGNRASYPAALLGQDGLAVGASTPAGTRAAFSTTGRYVDLLAPGVGVLGAIAGERPEHALRPALRARPGTASDPARRTRRRRWRARRRSSGRRTRCSAHRPLRRCSRAPPRVTASGRASSASARSTPVRP